MQVRDVEPAEDADPAALAPALRRDADELDGFLEFLAGEMAHAGPRRRRRRDPRRHRGSGRHAALPAAGADGHHGYAGGLLEHTVGVATLCRETAQLHPRLRADLLLAAALLHDVGRTRELGSGPASAPTEEGRLLGHVHLGLRLIEERADGLDAAVRAELLHAVAVHHDRQAARTAEAAVLYHANQLDAQAATRPVGDELVGERAAPRARRQPRRGERGTSSAGGRRASSTCSRSWPSRSSSASSASSAGRRSSDASPPAGGRRCRRRRPASAARSASRRSTAAWRSARWASSHRSRPLAPIDPARCRHRRGERAVGGAARSGWRVALAGVAVLSREPGENAGGRAAAAWRSRSSPALGFGPTSSWPRRGGGRERALGGDGRARDRHDSSPLALGPSSGALRAAGVGSLRRSLAVGRRRRARTSSSGFASTRGCGRGRRRARVALPRRHGRARRASCSASGWPLATPRWGRRDRGAAPVAAG